MGAYSEVGACPGYYGTSGIRSISASIACPINEPGNNPGLKRSQSMLLGQQLEQGKSISIGLA